MGFIVPHHEQEASLFLCFPIQNPMGSIGGFRGVVPWGFRGVPRGFRGFSWMFLDAVRMCNLYAAKRKLLISGQGGSVSPI